MKVIGNILDITTQRDNKHKDIEVYLDTVEYLTSRKDGKYYQAFDFVEELEEPLIITGDCLARADAKQPKDGEYEFKVYDKDGDEYILNPGKKLYLTMVYDFDVDLAILSEAYYAVTLPDEEFKILKTAKEKEQAVKGWKNKKKKK